MYQDGVIYFLVVFFYSQVDIICGELVECDDFEGLVLGINGNRQFLFDQVFVVYLVSY